MTTTLEHTAVAEESQGGGLARYQNAGTAVAGGVLFAFLFWLIARKTMDPTGEAFNDQVTTILGCGWIIGFWFGIGAFNGPMRWLLGRDHSRADDLYYAGHNQGRARSGSTPPTTRSLVCSTSS